MSNFSCMLVLGCMVCLPLKQMTLTSAYGYRVHPVTGKYSFHAGIDLRADHDTVYSILDGKVTATGYDNFLGIYIRLDHGDFQSSYGHLSKIFVRPGDTLSAGSPIGITGMTGRVTGAHLHFSVQYKHQYINPITFLYNIFKSKNHE